MICRARTALLVLALVLAFAGAASAQRIHRAVGVAQTGLNDVCGTPVWSVGGQPSGPGNHGTFVGLYDDAFGATLPFPLVAGDCDPQTGSPNARLATSYDDAFGSHRGWTAPNDRLENLPLLSIPVAAGGNVYAQIPLPGSLPPNPLPPTIAEPTAPVTLGSWLSASGALELQCDDLDQTGTISIRLDGLVPERLYSVWANWLDTLGDLSTAPLGGLPNLVVADESGSAEYCRAVEFCPLDLAPNGSDLQFVSVLFVGDGVPQGSSPYDGQFERTFVGLGGLPFVSTSPAGVSAFDHVSFRVNATGGPDPGPHAPAICVGEAQPVGAAHTSRLLPATALFVLAGAWILWAHGRPGSATSARA